MPNIERRRARQPYEPDGMPRRRGYGRQLDGRISPCGNASVLRACRPKKGVAPAWCVEAGRAMRGAHSRHTSYNAFEGREAGGERRQYAWRRRMKSSAYGGPAMARRPLREGAAARRADRRRGTTGTPEEARQHRSRPCRTAVPVPSPSQVQPPAPPSIQPCQQGLRKPQAR